MRGQGLFMSVTYRFFSDDNLLATQEDIKELRGIVAKYIEKYNSVVHDSKTKKKITIEKCEALETYVTNERGDFELVVKKE